MQLLKYLTAIIISIIIFNVIAIKYLIPCYNSHITNNKIKKLNFIIDSIQLDFVQHYKEKGYFPNINGNHTCTQLYDINTWHKQNITAQFAVIQAMVNSIELGLEVGQGGMITCLLAKRPNIFESKCFYQLKQG